jgi:hypothetical protein
VLDPTAGEQLLPRAEPVEPLLDETVPTATSAEGALVEDFPASLPVADDSTVVSSSVAPGGTRVQATLVAETPASATTVVEFYQGVFVPLGLVATELPAATGATAMSFARDGDSITLTATSTAHGTEYSLFGVLTPRTS